MIREDCEHIDPSRFEAIDDRLTSFNIHNRLLSPFSVVVTYALSA
jgi:hypothetical protein